MTTDDPHPNNEWDAGRQERLKTHFEHGYTIEQLSGMLHISTYQVRHQLRALGYDVPDNFGEDTPKKQGTRLWRNAKATDTQFVQELLNQEMSVRDIAKRCNRTTKTIYNIIARHHLTRPTNGQ
jgi:hypothetical protein